MGNPYRFLLLSIKWVFRKIKWSSPTGKSRILVLYNGWHRYLLPLPDPFGGPEKILQNSFLEIKRSICLMVLGKNICCLLSRRKSKNIQRRRKKRIKSHPLNKVLWEKLLLLTKIFRNAKVIFQYPLLIRFF